MYEITTDDRLHGVSTIIKSKFQDSISQGTGFFYYSLADKTVDGKNVGLTEVKEQWLVTNRHIVLPRVKDNDGKEIEVIPETITFLLRFYVSNSDKWQWDNFTIDKRELLKRVKIHTNKDVDVAIISIGDLLSKKYTEDPKNKHYMNPFALTKDHQISTNNKIKVEIGSDVLIIGYPKSYYDKYNLYPIVKSGIIASAWGLNFENKPYFLIDAKLFPGSSGSLVISKPVDFLLNEGQIIYSKEKKYALLGIFSGEKITNETIELENMTIINKSGYNLGIVWYGYLIEEIIENGKKIDESEIKSSL